MIGLAAVVQAVDPADDPGLLPHRRPRHIGTLVVSGAELDGALRRVSHHLPERVEALDAEDAEEGPSGALDPVPVRIDHRAIGE